MSETTLDWDLPTGNNEPVARTFPLPSLRQFLMPDQTVQLKLFQAPDLPSLESGIQDWVQTTKAIIAAIGPVSSVHGLLTLSLTYVAAAEGVIDVQA
jgi:hypothetical protein